MAVRRRWTRTALWVGAVGGFVVVAAGIGLVILVWLQNRPAHVPRDFRAPATLSPGSSPVPAGALLFDSDRSGNYEIYAAEPAGSTPRALTSDPAWDSWWPRLSPDRRHVLFYRSPAGVHDLDFKKTWLWVMNADGTSPVLLRPPGLNGWAQQGHAEWSPDGRELVMFGGRKTNPQIFVTTNTGSNPRAVTSRSGTNIDPSWSPDGADIAFVGCPRAVCLPRDYEVYVAAVADRTVRRITDDRLRDHDPYFSPDGKQLAWLTNTSSDPHPTGSWNIRTAAADGTNVRRLTDDHNVNSKPQWSTDGRFVFFHRLVLGQASKFQLFRIAADGTGLTEMTDGQPGNNEFPST